MRRDGYDFLVLQDEDGDEDRFVVLYDRLQVKDRLYIVLMPADSYDEEEPEMVILRAEYDDQGQGLFHTIDDDEEWEEVLLALQEVDFEAELAEYDLSLDDEEDEDEDEDFDDDDDFDFDDDEDEDEDDDFDFDEEDEDDDDDFDFDEDEEDDEAPPRW